MSKPTRIYWDACTWIAAIKPEPKNKERLAMCVSVLNRAKKKDLEIVVSAFTLAEVCKDLEARSKQKNKLPLFLDHPYILILPVDKYIGVKAQVLQTTGKVTLKPADAVHIATAQYSNVEEFHTFDGDLLKLNGDIFADNGNKIKICKPGEGNPLKGLFEEKKP